MLRPLRDRRPEPGRVSVEVIEGDARAISCDVLALKFAQGHHGVDAAVASRLGVEATPATVPPGGHLVIDRLDATGGPGAVIFIGAPPLHRLGYAEIRELSSRALALAAEHAPAAEHLALTLHGAGYGLDETECMLAAIGGLVDGFAARVVGPAIRRISFVERNRRRAERMASVLASALPDCGIERDATAAQRLLEERPRSLGAAGIASGDRTVAYVAMAMSGGTIDLFTSAVAPAVARAGHLCEWLVPTGGDPVAAMMDRIRSARVVIADLTGGHPHVYLQVGYSWGAGVPVIAVVGTGEETKVFPFDIRERITVVYEDADDLERRLTAALEAVESGGGGAP